jgi:uncharacterized protein YaiI (UPF0178 family)
MSEVFVDADACPVKDEVIRVIARHGVVVHMVSNGWLRLEEHPLVDRVVVAQGADVADDWIAERAGRGDVVVTADIPLAARCLASGARLICHAGRLFTEGSIGSALAKRALSAHLRETGEMRGGGPMFTKKDRLRFLDALERELTAARRETSA